MRILITGGNGQLGRALNGALPDDDVLSAGRDELDITDAGVVRDAVGGFRPDVVIHAAAWTDTIGCEKDPQRATAVNAVGSRNVAEACRTAGAAMLNVGSNEIFDGEKGSPYAEDDRPHPLNEYGRSKLEGELAVRETLEQHWTVRTSWVYGPGRVSFPEKIIAMARERGSLKLVTDEIASPTWTLDLASAIAQLIRNPEWGVYHLTNSGACSRKEWAVEVLRLAELEDVPVEETRQAEFGAPYRKPVDSTLANVRAAAMGVTLRPWQEALADHIQYLSEQAAAPGQAGR